MHDAPYHDVYVLSPERSPRAALRFLATFAPHANASASEYWFPQYAQEPTVVFNTVEEAIQYCTQYPNESQSLYFINHGGNPAHVMLFFTSDGGLILGLSVVDGKVDRTFIRLKEHTGSDIGYITFESPPCETVVEFAAVARRVNI